MEIRMVLFYKAYTRQNWVGAPSLIEVEGEEKVECSWPLSVDVVVVRNLKVNFVRTFLQVLLTTWANWES